MKHKNRKLVIDEKVRILGENNTFINAKYKGDIIIRGEFSEGLNFYQDTPKFELEDGSCKYGYECWWISEKEALEAEKIVKELCKNENP